MAAGGADLPVTVSNIGDLPRQETGRRHRCRLCVHEKPEPDIKKSTLEHIVGNCLLGSGRGHEKIFFRISAYSLDRENTKDDLGRSCRYVRRIRSDRRDRLLTLIWRVATARMRRSANTPQAATFPQDQQRQVNFGGFVIRVVNSRARVRYCEPGWCAGLRPAILGSGRKARVPTFSR